MEKPCSMQDKDRSQRKEKVTEQDKSYKEIGICKSEPSTELTKLSEESLVRKSRKKHCDWMQSTSNTYCSNTKLFKNYHLHRKTYGRLKKYIKDEPRIVDLPQKCETLSR